MSALPDLSGSSLRASRWRLWIDGCGGYLLVTGDRWSVGGVSERKPADVSVRADWPRLAGTILYRDADYFWDDGQKRSTIGGSGRQVPAAPQQPQLMTHGQTLPIPGSARLTFRQPSPLCSSATLSVSPPHRFVDHVDTVILVRDSFLVGPDTDCHVQANEVPDRVIVTLRGQKWLTKAGASGDFLELSPGTRVCLPSLTMTLEEA